MNTLLYSEHRVGHRRLRLHARRILVTGMLPLLISASMMLLWPHPGPGVFAVFGLSAAGLFVFGGVYGLPRSRGLSRPAAWAVERVDRWFPCTLILLQYYFIALVVCLLWFNTAELGFPATMTHHILLMSLLVITPIRRILQGIEPEQPSAAWLGLTAFLRYTNASLWAIFVATIVARLLAPQATDLETTVGFSVVIWVPALLIAFGSIILFLDQLMRKMPPPPTDTEKDTLE